MTLTELRYIVALAETNNFSRAAEKCFVSQPTLSVAVKKLEEQLGVKIFNRDKTAVCSTEIGRKIIQQARTVLEEVSKLKNIADAGQDELAQPLRIGAIHTIGPYLFPKLIPQIQKIAAKLPLIVQEDYTAQLQDKLRSGEVDAVIIALPFIGADVTTVKLYDEPFDVVIPHNHHWQHKNEIQPQDFASETLLLLSDGNCLRDQVIAACPACAVPKEAQSDAERMLEGSSLETIRYMVKTNMGVSVFPRSSLQQHHTDEHLLDVKRFADPEPYRQVGIAYRSNFSRPKAIQLLIKAIQSISLITKKEEKHVV